jgi:hypothetical protein
VLTARHPARTAARALTARYAARTFAAVPPAGADRPTLARTIAAAPPAGADRPTLARTIAALPPASADRPAIEMRVSHAPLGEPCWTRTAGPRCSSAAPGTPTGRTVSDGVHVACANAAIVVGGAPDRTVP